MDKSLMYDFLINMWVTNRVMEEFLVVQMERGFITEKELNQILSTPKNN